MSGKAKSGAGQGGSVARFRTKGRPCPICKKPAIVEHRPFCSKRCAQIDLGRWLGEVYRAPAEDEGWTDSEIWSESPLPAQDGDGQAER